MRRPRILLCDDDGDMVELMGELLRESGAEACVVTRSFDEVLAHAPEALACDVAILDVNLGPGRPSGVDVYRWLIAQGFVGRSAFLTGHAKDHPLVAVAAKTGGVPILSKPMSAADLIRWAQLDRGG